jgi:hypothetical protein
MAARPRKQGDRVSPADEASTGTSAERTSSATDVALDHFVQVLARHAVRHSSEANASCSDGPAIFEE